MLDDSGPCDHSARFDVGSGGGTCCGGGLYACGWLALRERIGWCVVGVGIGLAPRESGPSYAERSRVELNWLRRAGRGPFTPKLASDV